MDEDNNPFILDAFGYPVLFHAEFNEGIFRGNVSAMDGTFAGVLTAEAVDAAGNITIAGEATAVTVVVLDEAGKWLTEGVANPIATANILVPAGESGIIYALVQYEVYSYGSNDTREQTWPTNVSMMVDDRVMNEHRIPVVPTGAIPSPRYKAVYRDGYTAPGDWDITGNAPIVGVMQDGSLETTTLSVGPNTGAAFFEFYDINLGIKKIIHNASIEVGEGLHNFKILGYWPELATNPHPGFKNVFVRLDYIRKS